MGQALAAAVQDRVIGLKLTSATNAQMKTTKQICQWLLKLSQWILLDSLVRSATRSLTARVFVNHGLRLSGQALAAAVQDRVIGLKLTSATNAQMNPTIFWCKRDIETNGDCSFRLGMSWDVRLLFCVCKSFQSVFSVITSAGYPEAEGNHARTRNRTQYGVLCNIL